jgi:hypothetical protein
MPSGTWVKVEFHESVVTGVAPGEARVLLGTYAGIPCKDEEDLYDLYRLGPDGEPAGECQGRLHSTVVKAASAKGV